MVNLTTSITNPNITKYEAIAFDVARASVTLRFYYGAGTTRFQDFVCYLSDTINSCSGVFVNAAPSGASDTIAPKAGVGVVSSLTNAIAAYRGAASHAQGLKALEQRGVTDTWLDGAMVGT